MGEAMIRGMLQSGLVPKEDILAADAQPQRLTHITGQYGIRGVSGNPELVREADVIVLAVKPQIMGVVLGEVAAVADGRKLFISVAAGVATGTIRSHLGRAARLIRVMPNTPALVLEGVTAIARAEGLEPADLQTAQELFGAVGRGVLPAADAPDPVTGFSGSGPPFPAPRIQPLP